MKYNYQYKIEYKADEKININYINNVCKLYPEITVLIDIPNTKSITIDELKALEPNILIRIAGAYDRKRLNIYRSKIFGQENCKSYYYDSVIYTREETIKIIEEIEKIESGILSTWSDFQKTIYLYDRLKSKIMYDPKYEKRETKDIRSLRGLITKQTVCAGYALILKEFLDRQNIKCEFVRGDGHAWNIVTIDDKLYPIDLTNANSDFRAGIFDSCCSLGQDPDLFNENNIPDKLEPTYGLQYKFSQLDPTLIEQINEQIWRTKDYTTTTFFVNRSDGSRFVISQIDNHLINGQNYYRYYYSEIDTNCKLQSPLILYGDINIVQFINDKLFKNPIPYHYEKTIANIMFSKKNIENSLNQNTYYIGSVRKKQISNKLQLVTKVEQIEKQEELKNLFSYPTKIYKRSNGSVFIVQQMLQTSFEIQGIRIMRYDIFEMLKENGKLVLKKNVVFTEKNLLKNPKQSIIDNFLSRERLDIKSNQTGGYIGYYDEDERIKYNQSLISVFEISKPVDFNYTPNLPKQKK